MMTSPIASGIDAQWARSAAAVLVGFLLVCGLLRAGSGLPLPAELRPLARLLATAACIVVPGPVSTPPGLARRLDAGRPVG